MSHVRRRRLTFTVSLKVLEIGPSRACTLHPSLDTVRKVGEEVESYLGLDLVNRHNIVRVGFVGIRLMLEPEPDGAGICDGTTTPLHLQDRLPVIVRYRDLGRNSAAARCCEIGDSFVSSYRLIAWTRSYVEGVTGSGDCPKAILERIPYPAVEPVLKLRSLVGHVIGLLVHGVVRLPGAARALVAAGVAAVAIDRPVAVACDRRLPVAADVRIIFPAACR